MAAREAELKALEAQAYLLAQAPRPSPLPLLLDPEGALLGAIPEGGVLVADAFLGSTTWALYGTRKKSWSGSASWRPSARSASYPRRTGFEGVGTPFRTKRAYDPLPPRTASGSWWTGSGPGGLPRRRPG